jgi:prepilin-type N-terminal cleavage/methylation domain-containing protein
MKRTHHSRRPGFTLIELIVVIGIIVVLMSLAVLVAPKFSERQRTSMGAGQFQGWLFTAKQRAYRDRLSRGLRLVPDVNTTSTNAVSGAGTVVPQSMAFITLRSVLLVDVGNPSQEVVTVLAVTANSFSAVFKNSHNVGFSIISAYVTTFRYIERPDDFTGGTLTVDLQLPGQPSADPKTAMLNFDATTNVNVGDYLEVTGLSEGFVHAITNVTPSTLNGQQVTLLDLNHQNPNAPGVTINVANWSTTNYRIIRAARPLSGEPDMKLPQDVAVDLSLSQFGGTADFLFLPSGALQQASGGKVIFWVRDTSLDDPRAGEPTLIAIYPRNGAIAAHPVNPDPNVGGGSPYYYTQDGRDSGM